MSSDFNPDPFWDHNPETGGCGPVALALLALTILSAIAAFA